jgi:hypothetical protein
MTPPREISGLDPNEEGAEHADVPESSSVLAPEERYECAEMLEFVAGWLKAEPRLMHASLQAYSPGYGVAELRWALLHFARRLMETTS